MTDEFVDVLVVGAGISGIGAGCHLQKLCPERSFAIVEARPSLGGTWDLFRYPGVRSDSDMHTLGYSFRPWTDPKAIADGPTILNYLRETAREHGLEPKIRFGQQVVRADWSSPDAQWTVELRRGRRWRQRAHPLRLPVHVQRLLRLRGRPPARLPRDASASAGGWSIRSTGPPTSTTRARRSSSSAAAPPP